MTVSIDVSHLQKAENFYIQALGAKKIRNQGEKMSIISIWSSEIYLQEKDVGTKSIPWTEILRDYHRHWTPVHIDFICENVDDIVKKVLEMWWSHEWWESADWWSIAHCADPFGNGFCIINE